MQGEGTNAIGKAFHDEVRGVLMLLPGATVETHAKIAGKEVDLVVDLHETTGTRRIAVECKGFNRELSREKVVQQISDYYPLLDQHLVDQVWLVTRSGIVGNAKSALDGIRFRHWTLSSLMDLMLNPATLLQNMKQQFSDGQVDQYYRRAACLDIDLEYCSTNFERVYNPFVDFALSLSRRSPQLDRMSPRWPSVSETHSHLSRATDSQEILDLGRYYSDALLREVLSIRATRKRADLEEKTRRWIQTPSSGEALAILGSYGTGKSTFSRKLATTLATEYLLDKTDRIPLLIELRHFGSHQDVESLITNALANHHSITNANFGLFGQMNRLGKFVIILDGFDEMKQGMTRDAIQFNFEQLGSLIDGRSKVILSGRPTVFDSEEEMAEIFAGGHSVHRHRFIPLQLAPLSTDEVVPLIRDYCSAQQITDESVTVRVSEIAQRLPSDPVLRDLLERPVHVPMLVKVLPHWDSPISELNRTALYRAFIDLTIRREGAKRRLGDLQFSIDERHRFASALAVEMFRQGEQRSIRSAMIPSAVFEEFARPGFPEESIRRELIASCFLEFKAPDILYFGHKSFAEFLVAEAFVDGVRSGKSTDKMAFALSAEVVSFTSDLMATNDWTRLLADVEGHSALLKSILRWAWKVPSGQPQPDISTLMDAIESETDRGLLVRLPDMGRYHLAEVLEGLAVRNELLPSQLQALCYQLLATGPDIASVHAYRALSQTSALDEMGLEKLIGGDRVNAWVSKGWIQFDDPDGQWLLHQFGHGQPFTIRDVTVGSDWSASKARKVVSKLFGSGRVAQIERDPGFDGRGRAPARYIVVQD